MGKSPGKWIKTLIFRKKASGSGMTIGRETLKATSVKDVRITGKEPHAEVAMDSPLISLPAAANANRSGEISELEKGLASNVPSGGVLLPVNHDAENKVTVGFNSSNDLEKFREEQAAIKAQASFRGYLARRAFRALKGIIRLQALIRGHLVRRQAVATLRSLQGLVTLQAVVRGRRVRRSDIAIKIRKTCRQKMTLDARSCGVNMSLQADKRFANAFVSKLLSPSPTGMPLLIQYGQGEPNSAWNWLERWTYSFFLKPLVQRMGSVGSKVQTKQGTAHTVETETGRPKRSFRKNSTAIDSGLTHLGSEFEKRKRNLKKISSHPVDVQEHPQNELEKVKRSLRKVSNSTTEVPDQLEVEAEKSKRCHKKAASSPSEVSDQHTMDSVEKMKKGMAVASADSLDAETYLKPVATDGPAEHDDHPAIELHPLEVSGNDGNDISVMNGELTSNEDQVSHENQKSNRRRASFPVKPEDSENSLQNSPTLPSYMATTESAKAKLRGQGSPRFGQDGAEKNGLTRRHSLPSATSGKVSSPSAWAQKLVQANAKGGIRSDRSLLSSRDGNEKVIQTEWRR